MGENERMARLAIGAAAGTSALMAERPWQKAVLAVVAVSGIATGLTRYCPISEAIGIRGPRDSEALPDSGRRDAELRRDIATREALGQPPGGGDALTVAVDEGTLAR